jgi:outer membrane lipoprotein carrier protein
MNPPASRRTVVVQCHARSLLVLVCALVCLPVAGRAKEADGACATDVAAHVQRHYDRVHDLRGRFEQRTERAALGGAPGDALVARGEVLFAKPGKMRWRYEAPEPSLVVSDGKTLWIFDETAREVQKLPLAEGYLSAAGVQFLLGEGKLADEFRITARGCDAPIVMLALSPLRPSHFEGLELGVDAKTAVVTETTVLDLFGNRTRVKFVDLRENTRPDASLFRFEVPAGVRVIELP